MPVRVVTDSSAQLSSQELRRWQIEQVALHVLVEDADLHDGADAVPRDVHQRAHVTTSGATPAALADAYRTALADGGGDGVVAVHLSGALSSTFGSAVAAARDVGLEVRVIDSRSAAMGVGFVALAAARAAATGGSLDDVEAAARAAIPMGRAFIVVHRLDNLRRSGRIGAAASWLGTALALKPLLCLDADGRLVLSQRIRTASKAHAALVDAVAGFVGDRRAAVAVHHVDNHDDADAIAAALTARLAGVQSLVVTDMGAALSVHLGAGAVGVCVSVGAR